MSSQSTLTAPSPEHLPRSRYAWYPGWTILGVAAMTQFMSAPGQSFSVAAFKDVMRQSLRVSETQYSLAYFFATLLSGLSLPFVGRLLDRIGARRLLPIIATLLGFACVWMSKVQTLTDLYTGFGMIRCLGQGALSLISMWLLGEWFEKRRGMATALSGLVASISVMTVPLLNGYMIRNFSWQTGWAVLGVCVWVVLVLPSILLVRDRPEDIGLKPDGFENNNALQDETRVPSDGPAISHDSWTTREVLRDWTFWKLLSVTACSGMVGTGLVFHCVAILSSRRVAPEWALGVISLQAGVGTLSALGAGWLTDRFPSRYLLFGAMMLKTVAVALLIVMPSPWLVILYGTLLGLHDSISRSAGSVVFINYYGRAHQGSVRGVALSIMILAAAAGPLPLAVSLDRYSSWTPALAVFACLPLIAGALVWTAYPPHRRCNPNSTIAEDAASGVR